MSLSVNTEFVHILNSLGNIVRTYPFQCSQYSPAAAMLKFPQCGKNKRNLILSEMACMKFVLRAPLEHIKEDLNCYC